MSWSWWGGACVLRSRERKGQCACARSRRREDVSLGHSYDHNQTKQLCILGLYPEIFQYLTINGNDRQWIPTEHRLRVWYWSRVDIYQVPCEKVLWWICQGCQAWSDKERSKYSDVMHDRYVEICTPFPGECSGSTACKNSISGALCRTPLFFHN